MQPAAIFCGTSIALFDLVANDPMEGGPKMMLALGAAVVGVVMIYLFVLNKRSKKA